jgi:hypothetical protein
MKAKITVQRCIVGRGKTPVPGYHVWRSYTPATSCGTLRSYWRYGGCGYHKGSYTCSEPDHIDTCSVRRPRLRNGRLSQTAFSLFLFVRDIMGWRSHWLEPPF